MVGLQAALPAPASQWRHAASSLIMAPGLHSRPLVLHLVRATPCILNAEILKCSVTRLAAEKASILQMWFSYQEVVWGRGPVWRSLIRQKLSVFVNLWNTVVCYVGIAVWHWVINDGLLPTAFSQIHISKLCVCFIFAVSRYAERLIHIWFATWRVKIENFWAGLSFCICFDNAFAGTMIIVCV